MKTENNITLLVVEATEDNFKYNTTEGVTQTVKTKGLFLKTPEGNFVGTVSEESLKFASLKGNVSLSDIRWVSRRSGFILMDYDSPRLKDPNRFFVDIKNPETKRFE